MKISDRALDDWIERGWPANSNSPRPSWSRDVFRELFQEEITRGAREAAKSLQAKLADEALRRVAALERQERVDPKVFDAVLTAVSRILDRLEEVEKRTVTGIDAAIDRALEERGLMSDAGIWSAGRAYRRGDVVTHRGSAWTATVASTGARPGDSGAWRMVAKSDISEVRRAVKDEVEKQLAGRPVVA
jgi:hypothetical protein